MPQPNTSTKKGLKIVLFTFLGLIAVAILAFFALFSYYLWVQKYGDTLTKQELKKNFSQKFTLSPGANSKVITVDVDPSKLIYSTSPQLGDTTAPVTVLSFIDFECPYSREAHTTFERIKDRFGSAVRVVFKHFPVEQIHPNAMNSALASQCAHAQGKFWPYYQKAFQIQKLDESSLVAYARDLQLNMTMFEECYLNRTFEQQVLQDLKDGIDIGVRGTPTYIVNGRKVEGSISETEWEHIILQALK